MMEECEELMRALETARRDASEDQVEVAVAVIRASLEEMVAIAGAAGFVVEVRQESLLPLAMGHYKTVVEVRRARGGV